ncbi:17-beta-hydroxysteroid dehydrogenase 13-like [Watersipora subatra]|uniref:17-beta-hydroxysteroid dehydrogenase 13-like n=1 Tax=Watersipora subatra TaxID=2589382 RepID=UPI00355B407E
MGNTVVLWDTDEEALNTTVLDIKKFGGVVHPFTLKEHNEESVIATANQVKEQVKTPISILVILSTKRKIHFDEPDVDVKHKTEEAQFPIWIINEFLPSMAQRNRGHIVEVSHLPNQPIIPRTIPYAASKYQRVGALEGIAEMLEETKSGVVCSTILTGAVKDGPCFAHKDTLLRSLFGPVTHLHIIKAVVEAIYHKQQLAYVPKVHSYWAKRLLPKKAFKLLQRVLNGQSCMAETCRRWSADEYASPRNKQTPT